MNKLKHKGFTIIELLIVIVIVGILAAIVLVNVTQYISKSKDAAIRGNLTTLMLNAAAYFDANPLKLGNDFAIDTVSGCAGPIVASISNESGSIVCRGSTASQAWCAYSLTPNGSACVDSTGYRGAWGGTGKCASSTAVTCL